MRLPFRIRIERHIEVRLYVELGFQSGRLADLIQFLAYSGVVITDLKTDPSIYHLGMPERSAEVTFLVTRLRQKNGLLRDLSAKEFVPQELSGSIR